MRRQIRRGRHEASIVAFAALHLELRVASPDALSQEHPGRVKAQNGIVYDVLRVESTVGVAQEGEAGTPIRRAVPAQLDMSSPE